MKRGIIQSRGLGDIIIALPIAKHYHDLGDEIYWPICEEFHSSFVDNVPWVNWIPLTTDPQGLFFLDGPRAALAKEGIPEEDQLYLYQYLSSMPELTDPELFAVLKFDQYKYWVSQVPFTKKWTLADCITRNENRESELQSKLQLSKPYAVVHLTGSSGRVDLDLSWIPVGTQIVDIDQHLGWSIFDWIPILEGAEIFVGLDSVFANMVDSLAIPINEKYWIRRSPWDVTPVLGQVWTMVETDLPTGDPQRVEPAKMAVEKAKALAAQAAKASSNVMMTAPFQASGAIPKDFMYALKK